MRKAVFIFSLFIFLMGCAPQAVFTVHKTAEPDSVLFYQQQNVADPFIDSILSTPGDSAEISILLIPPPPADTVRFVQGFRVQVFAGLDSFRAAGVYHQLSGLLQDSIYLFKENGLFKVQAGDFLHRPQADSVQRELTIQSFPGTWVVKRLIIAPDSASTASPTSKNILFKYTIQILATGDESRAIELINKLQEQVRFPAYYKKIRSVYKIFIGKFKLRTEADKALKEIRKKGYPDAWIVY